VVILEFILAPALAAAASIPVPYELLKIIRYAPTNLHSRSGTHYNHRLRSLNTLLLALITSNQQRVNLAAIKTIIVPIETILKLPEVSISSRKYEDGLTLLANSVRRPLFLRWSPLKRVLLLADLDCYATKEST